MSQAELAEAVGCAASTIAMYETGKREPDMDTIEAIADVFNVRIRDLVPDKSEPISTKNVIQLKDMSRHRIPLLGSAAAGEPIYDEEVDVYVDGPLKADCAIRVKGESMEPTYLDGDVLYIRSQQNIDYDGQIAVVVCGEEACVKHVYRQPEGLLLTSDNPQYSPMFKSFSDYDNNIRVIGRVVGFTRMYSE
jgi:repressor LexA